MDALIPLMHIHALATVVRNHDWFAIVSPIVHYSVDIFANQPHLAGSRLEIVSDTDDHYICVVGSGAEEHLVAIDRRDILRTERITPQ